MSAPTMHDLLKLRPTHIIGGVEGKDDEHKHIGSSNTYIDFAKIPIPDNPELEGARLYIRTDDANNNKLYILIKTSNTMVEREIALVT